MATKRTFQQLRQDLQQIQRNLKTIAKSFHRSMRGKVFAGRVVRALQTKPGPPRYPIRWTSKRQRRAFFATNGFGRGIPTRRTGAIAAGWKAEFIATEDGGILAISNPREEAKFVQGPQPFGQGFHRDTGWAQIDDYEEMFYADSQGVATQVFFNELDPFAI